MTTAVEAQPKVSRSARYRRVMESLMIRDEHGRIVPLHFSDSQEILWSQVAPRLERKEKIWDICLKPRQVYASTFYCGLGFVRTLEAPLTHSLVIAQDLDTSSELFDKVKFFYEHFPLPKVGKPTVKTLNVPLPGGISRYRVISAGIAAKGRGTTQSVMHCSEVAFWQHPEILTGILQVMPDLPNTILVLESTANGMRGTGEMFYEEWMRAVSGESGLNPIFIPWWVMPKYRKTPGIPADDWDEDERLLHELCGVDGEQLAWRRWAINTKLQGSADLFNQEYPSTPEMAFIFSGQPAFDHRAIYRQREHVRTPLARGTLTGPERKDWTEDPKGDIRIWKWPEAGHQYVLGADTSEGIEGGDYACAEVLDMQTLEQAAVLHGLIPTWDFATLVNYLGRFYHNAVLAVEVNNTGHAVQDHLIHHYYYPRLHRWRGKPDRIKWGDSKLYGWECVDPEAKVLTADLRWVLARQVKTGETLLGCREFPGRNTGATPLRIQAVMDRQIFVAPLVEVTLDDGRQTRVSTTHPFWTRRSGRWSWQWVPAADLRPGDMLCCLPVWEELRSYEAGRLSAFLDGEGHLSQGKVRGLHLLVSQAEGPLAQEIRDLWESLGFQSTFKWVRHKKRPHEKPVAVSGMVQLMGVLRALGSLRPTRLLQKFSRLDTERLTIRSFARIRVQSVRSAGDGPVVGLTTAPDHTLIADGIVGHNTNTYSRPLLIEAGRRAVNTNLVTIREEKLLDELKHFSKNDFGKYEAEAGHDDRVLALLIALRSREENYFPARVQSESISDHALVGLPTGVHVVDQDEPTYTGRKRIGQLLRDRAKQAVKSWMEF